MKPYKFLIEDLCKHLEWTLNVPQDVTRKYIKVDFYHDHFHHVGAFGFGFTATISVDRICIFREVIYYDKPTKKEETERNVFERLLNAIFCYGVMAAKKDLDKMFEPQNPPTNQ